jgi:CHAD domain-containing protein
VPAGRRVVSRPLDFPALARMAGLPAARGARSGPVKARPAPLAPVMSVNDAFRKVMAAGLAHLLANERGLRKGADPEFLHQARVALRRLRSALDVFSPPLPGTVVGPVERELKWMASRLGPARDWDVLMTETLPPIEAEFGAQPGLKAFSARCRGLRRSAGAEARRAARSARYRRLTLKLSAWIIAEGWRVLPSVAARAALQGPVGGHARTVLQARYRRVRKRGRGLGALSAARLHRLRIAIKKFRYAADFFSGLYRGQPVREALRRLSHLQDILGAMNDAATAADLAVRVCRGRRSGDLLEARGILLGWNRARAAQLKKELNDAWRSFRAARTFW